VQRDSTISVTTGGFKVLGITSSCKGNAKGGGFLSGLRGFTAITTTAGI